MIRTTAYHGQDFSILWPGFNAADLSWWLSMENDTHALPVCYTHAMMQKQQTGPSISRMCYQAAFKSDQFSV